MKKTVFFILFFTLIIISVSAFADYKIILKNGREFVVEEYKDSNGKIKLYRGGGEIEIDKNSIKEIKKVKAPKTPESTDASGIVRYDEPEKKLPEGKENEAKTKSIAAESRLREIAKKKEELKKEGEKLTADRKKLEEEMKKKGHAIYLREEREYKRRLSEIDEKIKKFNEEVSKLDAEETALSKEAGGQQK